jgi:hypothetical protein
LLLAWIVRACCLIILVVPSGCDRPPVPVATGHAYLVTNCRLEAAVGGGCGGDPCSPDPSQITITTNSVAAQDIEDFLAQASSISASGEIGSFRWAIGEQPMDASGHIIRMDAGGIMTLPALAPGAERTADKPLILEAVQRVKAHEARHRDVFLAMAERACRDIMAGEAATDVIRHYFCETGPDSNAAAQRQVDLVDGMTSVVVAANGTRRLQSSGADHGLGSYITQGLCD